MPARLTTWTYLRPERMSLPTLKRILTLYSTPSLTVSGFCLSCASCSLDCCRLIETLPPGAVAETSERACSESC